jgi:hypothetical protein
MMVKHHHQNRVTSDLLQKLHVNATSSVLVFIVVTDFFLFMFNYLSYLKYLFKYVIL